MNTTRRICDDERHAHFVTFACNRRRKLLQPDRTKRIVIGTLGSWLSRRSGLCLGFVVMPNHLHALIWFSEINQRSGFMDVWKTEASVRIRQHFERFHPAYWSRIEGDDSVWQSKYHSFNVFSEKKLAEKLDYIHLNPVRAGLVEKAIDWPWSSARWHLQRKPAGIPIRMPPGVF